MTNKRASFNVDEIIDIKLLKNNTQNNRSIDHEALEKISEESGFIKRQPKKTRIRRKRSPYVEQLGIKTRPLIKEIFYAIGEKMSVYDHTTFELAIQALLEKNNDQNLIKKYKDAISKKM